MLTMSNVRSLAMPRPGITPGPGHEYLTLKNLDWLNDALGGGFVRGGVYLGYGEPGVGKSTLVQQALGDFARQGIKSLYMSSEQTLGELSANLMRLFGRGGKLPAGIAENFFLEDGVKEVDELPRFLMLDVLPPGTEYHGVKVLVYDSVQGKGLSSNASRSFKALYEFTEIAKANGIVTILLGHVNKAGQIAGPKTLEHNVDVTLYLRRVFRMRPLFVTKNRFGEAVLDPIPLVMDEQGRLEKSPQATAKTATVYGYHGAGPDFAEVQASVSLAKFGASPRMNAPFLPRPKMQQLLKVLGGVKGVDLSELSYEVNAYVPGRTTYSANLDLPLAISLLSSYLHLPVPEKTLFIGEVDLTGRVRPPEASAMERLARLLSEDRRGEIQTAYISEKVLVDFATCHTTRTTSGISWGCTA
jgi:DNA repair protein RadA/Sms